MSDSLPPANKVNKTNPLKAYVCFFAWLLPAVAFIVFASMILMARVELLLEKANIEIMAGVPLMGILSTARFVQAYFWLLVPFFAAILILPEFFWRRYDEVRSTYLGVIAYATNLVALSYLTLIAIVAAGVAPALLR